MPLVIGHIWITVMFPSAYRHVPLLSSDDLRPLNLLVRVCQFTHCLMLQEIGSTIPARFRMLDPA
jgi:hypothetical protein